MVERENTADASFDSGISVVDRPDDFKKDILKCQRILFILDRDRDKHAQTRNRLSQIADRKPKQKKTDVCNVCCETIDLEDFKCCVTCCNCGKDVCRGRQCSTWLPSQAEWECHLCNLSNESRSRTNEWIHRQVLPNLNPRPMSMRSDITAPVRGNNGSHLPYSYETRSEAASFCPEEKERVRGYVEDILAGMLGGSLDDVSVGQLYRSREYLPLSGSENNYGGVSHVKLKRLIERIIEDTLHLPALIDYSGVPGRQEESLPYFDPKRYQELLATAVLNKIVDSYNYEKKFSSNPEIQTAADLDNNHNTVITRKDQRTYSSSSSIEPRSDSSLADAINLNRQQDVSPSESYSNLLPEAIKQNPQQDDESLLSDYIAKHRVPLPDFTLELDGDSASDDLVSIATSHGGQEGTWENNWLFKRKKPGSDNPAPIGMLVPAPKEDVRALIGDRTTDEVSDLSEAGSDLEDDVNDVNSDESPNGRVHNKHLIGGKSTVGIFDELLEQTSLVSISSLPENEPAYTETKNDFVLGNDGLHDVQSPKLNLVSGNITIQNEAVNSEVMTQLLENHQTSKHTQSAVLGNSIEETMILPPPPCFIDSEEGACKLEVVANDSLNDGPLSNDSNAAQSQLINELNSATNNTNTENADIIEISTNTNETIESTITENRSFLRESRETLVTRRASAIEFLAVFALSPVLAFSTSEIDNRIIMKPTVKNIIEDSDGENQDLRSYSIGTEPSIENDEVPDICAEEEVSETCFTTDSDSLVEEAKETDVIHSEQISEQNSTAKVKELRIEETEENWLHSVKLEEPPQLKEEIVTSHLPESTDKISIEESPEDNLQNLEEVKDIFEELESHDTAKENKSSDVKVSQEPVVEREIPSQNFETVTESVKSATESAVKSEEPKLDNVTVPNESCDIKEIEKTTDLQAPAVSEAPEILRKEAAEFIEDKKEIEEISSKEELTQNELTDAPLKYPPSESKNVADADLVKEGITYEVSSNLEISVKEEMPITSDTTPDPTAVIEEKLIQESVKSGECDATTKKSEEIEVLETKQEFIELKEIEASLQNDNIKSANSKVEEDQTEELLEDQPLKMSTELLATETPEILEVEISPAALTTQDIDEKEQSKAFEELKPIEDSLVSTDASVLQINLNPIIESTKIPKEIDTTISLTEEQLSKENEITNVCIEIASVIKNTALESQQSQKELEISETFTESQADLELSPKENLIICENEIPVEIPVESEASSISTNQKDQNISEKVEELSTDLNISENSFEPHVANETNVEDASKENTDSDRIECEDIVRTCEIYINKSEVASEAALLNNKISIKDDVDENSTETLVDTPPEAPQDNYYYYYYYNSKTEETNSQNVIAKSKVDENEQMYVDSEKKEELSCEEPQPDSGIIINEVTANHDSSIGAGNSEETNKLSNTKENEQSTIHETSVINEAHSIAFKETSTVKEDSVFPSVIDNPSEDKGSPKTACAEKNSAQVKEDQRHNADEAKELTSDMATDEHARDKIEENIIHSKATELETSTFSNKNEEPHSTVMEDAETLKSELDHIEETRESVVSQTLETEVPAESISPASSNFSLLIDSVKTVDIRKYSISEQDIKNDVLSELTKVAAKTEDMPEAVKGEENLGITKNSKQADLTETLSDAEFESKEVQYKENASILVESPDPTSEICEASKVESAFTSKDSQCNSNITTSEENQPTEVDASSSANQTVTSDQKNQEIHVETAIQTKAFQPETVMNKQASFEESTLKIQEYSEVNVIDGASILENETNPSDPAVKNAQDVEKLEVDSALQTSQKVMEEIVSTTTEETLKNATLPEVVEQAPITDLQCEDVVEITTEKPPITETQNLQTLESKYIILTPPLEFQCGTNESPVPLDTNLDDNKEATSGGPVIDHKTEGMRTETADVTCSDTIDSAGTCNLKIEASIENEDNNIKTEENKENETEEVSSCENEIDVLPSNEIITECQQINSSEILKGLNLKEEVIVTEEPNISSEISTENNEQNKNIVSEIKESETNIEISIITTVLSSSTESSSRKIVGQSIFASTETRTIDEISVEAKTEVALEDKRTENIIPKEAEVKVDFKESKASQTSPDGPTNESEESDVTSQSQEVLQEHEDAQCVTEQNIEEVIAANTDANPTKNKDSLTPDIENNTSSAVIEESKSSLTLEINETVITESSTSIITEDSTSPLINEDTKNIDKQESTTVIEEPKSSSEIDNDIALNTDFEASPNSVEVIQSVVKNDEIISKGTELTEACETSVNIESEVTCSNEVEIDTAQQNVRQYGEETELGEVVQPESEKAILKETEVIEEKHLIIQSTVDVHKIPEEKSSINNSEPTQEESLNPKNEEISLVPSAEETGDKEATESPTTQKVVKLKEAVCNEDPILNERAIAVSISNILTIPTETENITEESGTCLNQDINLNDNSEQPETELSEQEPNTTIKDETKPTLEAPIDKKCSTDSSNINEDEKKVVVQSDTLVTKEAAEDPVESSLPTDLENNSSTVSEISSEVFNEVSIKVQETELSEPAKIEQQLNLEELSEENTKVTILLESTERTKVEIEEIITIIKETSITDNTSIVNNENIGVQSIGEEQNNETFEEVTEMIPESATRAVQNSENIVIQSLNEEEKSKIKEPTETIEELIETADYAKETIEVTKEMYVDAKETFDDAEETIKESTETFEEAKEIFEDAKETIEELTETFEDAKETIEEPTETMIESTKEHVIQNESSTRNSDKHLNTVPETEETAVSLEISPIDICSAVLRPSTKPSLSPTAADTENEELTEIVTVTKVIEDTETLSSTETDKAIKATQIPPPVVTESNSSIVINDETVAAVISETTKVEHEEAKLDQTASKIGSKISQISEPSEELNIINEDSNVSFNPNVVNMSEKKDNEESVVSVATEDGKAVIKKILKEEVSKAIKEEVSEVISTSENPHSVLKVSNTIPDATTGSTEIVDVTSKQKPALVNEVQNIDVSKDSENQQEDSMDLNVEQTVVDDSCKVLKAETEQQPEEKLVKESTSEELLTTTSSKEEEIKVNTDSATPLISSDTIINQPVSTTELKSDSTQEEVVSQAILELDKRTEEQVIGNIVKNVDEEKPENIKLEKPDLTKEMAEDSCSEKVEQLDTIMEEELHTSEPVQNTSEEPSPINEDTQSKDVPEKNIETQHKNTSEFVEGKTVLDASLTTELNTVEVTPQNPASENEEVQDVEQIAKVNLEECNATKKTVDTVCSKEIVEESKEMSPIAEVVERTTEDMLTEQTESSLRKINNDANNTQGVEFNKEECDSKAEETVAKPEQKIEAISDQINEIGKSEEDPDNCTIKLEEKTENKSTEEKGVEEINNLEENAISSIQTAESEKSERELQPAIEIIEIPAPLKEGVVEAKKEEIMLPQDVESAAENNNLITGNIEETTSCTNIDAIEENNSIEQCEEAITINIEACEKEEIKLEQDSEAIHFAVTSEPITISTPKDTSTEPIEAIEEVIVKEDSCIIEAKKSEENTMVETNISQDRSTISSELAIQHEMEVEQSAQIITSSSFDTGNTKDVDSENAINHADPPTTLNPTKSRQESSQVTSDSMSRTVEEPLTEPDVNFAINVPEKLEQEQPIYDCLKDSKEKETEAKKESNINTSTATDEDNEAPSNEQILETLSSEETNFSLEKNTDEVAEVVLNLEQKSSFSNEELIPLSDAPPKTINAPNDESLLTSEEIIKLECVQIASDAVDIPKVSTQNLNQITPEEINLTLKETTTPNFDEEVEAPKYSSIHTEAAISAPDTEYRDEIDFDESSNTPEKIPIQDISSLPLPTVTEETEPPEKIQDKSAEMSFQTTLNSDANVTTIQNTETTEISSSNNTIPSEILSEILSEIPKLTSPDLLGKNNNISNNTTSEKQNKEIVTNEKCPSSILQFSVSTVCLKSPVISTDKASSDSNTTDESLLTVIDACELQQNIDDEPQETADDIVDVTTDNTTTNNTINKTLTTITTNTTTNTTTKNTNTSLDKTLNTNSVDTNISNETGLENSSVPESPESTSISKPLSEEHDVAERLKHLVPGSIAEREYKKWYNAVEMPNNPYTPEAIQRRLSLTEKPLDIPNIKPAMERTATVEMVLSCDDTAEDIETTLEAKSDYMRYSRDYYINDAKHASGTMKSKTKSTSQLISNTDDEQGTSNHEPLSGGITTTCLSKPQSTADKQSDNADIFLARPIRVEENDPLLDKATKFEHLNTPERDFILLASGEVDSLRNTSTPASDQGSSLTGESLTTSEDSDTIRIYDLNNQETRLVKDETNAVKSPPNTPIRPTVLSFMPKTSPPTKVLTPTRIVTPTSLRFLQPKRKIFDPKQIMTESFEKTAPIPDGDHEDPPTNGIGEKPVIEKEVASSLPSVRALAQAFLLASKRNSNPLTRPKSPSLQSLEVKNNIEATNENKIEDGPSPDSYTPPYDQAYNPVSAPSGDDTSEGVVEERKIVYSVETPAAERPISPVLTPGQLRNSIAFFENLKKQ